MEAEQQGYKLVPMWDVGVAGRGFTCYATMWFLLVIGALCQVFVSAVVSVARELLVPVEASC